MKRHGPFTVNLFKAVLGSALFWITAAVLAVSGQDVFAGCGPHVCRRVGESKVRNEALSLTVSGRFGSPQTCFTLVALQTSIYPGRKGIK